MSNCKFYNTDTTICALDDEQIPADDTGDCSNSAECGSREKVLCDRCKHVQPQPENYLWKCALSKTRFDYVKGVRKIEPVFCGDRNRHGDCELYEEANDGG